MAETNATKHALAETMKKMMAERPFEKISVSDICEECGINRKSFYYHFRDKYDLVNWIFDVGFLTEMDLDAYDGPWEWLTDITRYFYRERVFYRAALKIEGQNSFRDYLMEVMTPVTQFFMKGVLAEEEETFHLTFVEDALLASLVRWLSGGYETEMDADEYLAHVKESILRVNKIL